jgi:sterol carrier protein 2
MAKVATTRALMDAGIDFKQVQAAIVGYVYGDSTCGQRYFLIYHRAVYEVGMTGIPIHNVNNNCATGSSALLLAKNLV